MDVEIITTCDALNDPNVATDNPWVASTDDTYFTTRFENTGASCTATIQAEKGTFTDTMNISVLNCGPPTLSLTPATPDELPVGWTQTFAVEANYAPANCSAAESERSIDVTEWLSADDWSVTAYNPPDMVDPPDTPTGMVTFGADGVATGDTDGYVQIYATYNSDYAGVTANSNTVDLEVVGIELLSMDLSLNRTLFEGMSAKLMFENVWVESDPEDEDNPPREYTRDNPDGNPPSTNTTCTTTVMANVAFDDDNTLGEWDAGDDGVPILLYAGDSAGGQSATITCTDGDVVDQLVVEVDSSCVAGFTFGIDLVFDEDDLDKLGDEVALVDGPPTVTNSAFDEAYPGLFPGVPFSFEQVSCVDNSTPTPTPLDNCAITYSILEGEHLIDFNAETGEGLVLETAEPGEQVRIQAEITVENGSCAEGNIQEFTFDVLDGDLVNIKVATTSEVPESDPVEYLNNSNSTIITSDGTIQGVPLPIEVYEPLQAAAVYQYNEVNYEFDITGQAAFESLHPEVAEFPGGTHEMNVLHTLEFGSTTIRAEYMGVISYREDVGEELGDEDYSNPFELDVEVTDKVVEYIEITAAVPTVVDSDDIRVPIDGFTVQLIVTAYFSDGDSEVVTDFAGWVLANNGNQLIEAHIDNTVDDGSEEWDILGKGLFTSGTEAGQQIITATYAYTGNTYGDQVTDSVVVYIDPGELDTLILVDADGDSATTSLYAGEANEYAALGTLVGSTTYYYIPDRDVQFISTNDEEVGDIDSNGLLTTFDSGTTTVIVNHIPTAIEDSVVVTVTDGVAEGIVCRPGWVQRTPGDTVNFVVQIQMSNITDPALQPAILDGTTEAETLTFDSSNDAVADFLPGSPLGLVTAGTTLGVATITANWVDPVSGVPFSDTCDIEVVEELVMPGSCDVAYYIDSSAQTIYGSTENAGNNATANSGNDVFYRFILNEPATIDLSVISPIDTWDIVPLVGYGCSGGGPTGYNDIVDSVTGELICIPSGSYYIVVDGTTADDWGAFEIDLDFEFDCVPEFEGSYVIDPGDV
jgi:hypothetical protein